MAVRTQRRPRAPLRYLWAIAAVFAVVAVVAVVVDAAQRASAKAAVEAAQVFQVTVSAEVVGGALPALQGHRVDAMLTDDGLRTSPTPSTATVSSLDTSVVTLSMAGGTSWWNVVPSVKEVDQEEVRSAEGDGVLVITDWETHIADSDTGQGGSTAALAGWRVQWGEAAPGECVIETPLRWVPASSRVGKIDGPVQVRVHITVAGKR